MGTRLGQAASLLLTFSVILLCLVLGEGALRHWFPLDNVVLQADSRYLYKFIPNSRQLIRPLTASGAPTVLMTINSQGRRGELLAKNKKRHIMVYGDSFVVAEGTPLKQTFVSQLADLLNAKAPQSVQVINAGVPGYGPDQESLVMEDEIDNVKPNLVVCAIYSGNDFGDLLRNKLFKPDEHQGLIPNHPTLDSNLVQGFKSALLQQPSFQTIRRAKNLLAMARAPHRAADNQYAKLSRELPKAWLIESQKEYVNGALEQDNQVHNLFLDGYDIDISTAPRSDSSRYKVALMERMIVRIQSIAASRSIPLIFLIIPSPIDVLDKWDVSIDTSSFPEYRRSALTGTLERIVKGHKFHYLNLFPSFRAHQVEDLFYHGLDDHWNARGQRLAAMLMADYISQNESLRTRTLRMNSAFEFEFLYNRVFFGKCKTIN